MAKKATTKKASTKAKADKVDPKIKALKDELKQLEEVADFDYPEEETVESLTELLAEVKGALEDADDDDGDDLGADDGDADADDSEDDSDDADADDADADDADAEDDDDDYDGDPSVKRPTALDAEDVDTIEEEIGDIKGDAICIVEGNQLIRTYYDAIHSEKGSSYKDKAEGFVEKRNAQHKAKDNGKTCTAVDANKIDTVHCVFRRETGKGDNRRVEVQKVAFTRKGNGKTFKEQAHALALKVANTPGQDGPGVVVLR